MKIFLCPTEFSVIGDYAAEMLFSLENAALHNCRQHISVYDFCDIKLSKV